MKHTITIDLPEPLPTPPEGWHLVDYRFPTDNECVLAAGQIERWCCSKLQSWPKALYWIVARNPEPPPASAVPDGWELDGYRMPSSNDVRGLMLYDGSWVDACLSQTITRSPFQHYWILRKKPTIPAKQGPPPIPAPYCDMWEHTGEFRQPMVGEVYLIPEVKVIPGSAVPLVFVEFDKNSNYAADGRWILRQKLTPKQNVTYSIEINRMEDTLI